MSCFIVPRIKKIFDERQQKIEAYIQKAEAVNKEALMSLERYESSLAKAKLDAEQRISEEKAKMAEDIAAKKIELNDLLEKKISQNEEILKKERQEIWGAIDEVSKNAAELILEKLGICASKD